MCYIHCRRRDQASPGLMVLSPGTCKGLRYDDPYHSSDRPNPALAQPERCPSSGRPGRAAGTGDETLTRQGNYLRGIDDHPSHRIKGARMNEVVVLTPERILEVTEDVLRRYGLAKATVVDVARALDVSHGSVYRHFPRKAGALAAHDVCDQAQAARRRPRDVCDLPDAGPRSLQGRQGPQGLPGRS